MILNKIYNNQIIESYLVNKNDKNNILNIFLIFSSNDIL